MTTFSANLGFLFTEHPLPEAIARAAKAGFAAVELHWPYDTPAREVAQALEWTGLPLMGLNTRRGDVSAGENGLAALPGREDEARAAIDEALDYAVQTGARAVHVMAGKAQGSAAAATFAENLRYACDAADQTGKTVLIEPLNAHDAPGYFLQSTDQAAEIIADIGAECLKLMFDCYHVGRSEGDVTRRLTELMPITGHIQFASVPDRGPPLRGELDYGAIFAHIAGLGWSAPLGAEYKAAGRTEDSLDWMGSFR